MAPTTTKTSPKTKSPDFIEGLRKLEKDPIYNNQSDATKIVIRSRIYDKYGEAYFKSHGINPDDTFRRKWINHESWDGKIGPTSGTSMLEQMERFDASLKKGTNKFKIDVYETEKKIIGLMAGKEPQGLGRIFKSKFDQQADDRIRYFKGREAEAEAWFGEHYNDSWKARIVELPGKAVGYGKDLVAMNAAAGIVGKLNAGILGGAGLTEKAAALSGKAKYAYNAIKEAATGYLYGKESGESGSKDAAIFAVLGVTGHVTVDATKYLSRMGVAGGTNIVASSIEAVKTLGAKKVAEAGTDKAGEVVVKATSKMLNELAVKAGYKDFWDAQAKGKSEDVMKQVAEHLKAGGKQAAVHNPDLVEKEVTKDFQELSKNPLGASLLDVMKKHGVDPVKTTVKHVTKATEVSSGLVTGHKQYEAVGAASTHSLEFEENVSKAIRSDFQFESREHKLLAAYARIQNGQGKDLGIKFRDYKGKFMPQAYFFKHLLDAIKSDPKYQAYNMRELGEIGNRILDHMRAVEKLGENKRIWRQAEFRPGKPRFSHQVELYKRSGMESGDFVPESKTVGVSRPEDEDEIQKAFKAGKRAREAAMRNK